MRTIISIIVCLAILTGYGAILQHCAVPVTYQSTPVVTEVVVPDSLYKVQFKTPYELYELTYKSDQRWRVGDSLEFKKIDQ